MESMAGLTLTAELHNHVRVHDRDRADKALQGHRPAAQEPEEDCKGDTEGDWAGSDAECAQASVGREEEPGFEVLLRRRLAVYDMGSTFLTCTFWGESIAGGVQTHSHTRARKHTATGQVCPNTHPASPWGTVEASRCSRYAEMYFYMMYTCRLWNVPTPAKMLYENPRNGTCLHECG